MFGQYVDSTECIETVLLDLICKTLAAIHLHLQKLPFKSRLLRKKGHWTGKKREFKMMVDGFCTLRSRCWSKAIDLLDFFWVLWYMKWSSTARNCRLKCCLYQPIFVPCCRSVPASSTFTEEAFSEDPLLAILLNRKNPRGKLQTSGPSYSKGGQQYPLDKPL